MLQGAVDHRGLQLGCWVLRFVGGRNVHGGICVPVLSPELERSPPSLLAVCMTFCKGKESGLDKVCCSL